MQVPDAIEPAVGYRVWEVIDTNDGLRIQSLNHQAVWIPNIRFEATCGRGNDEHEVPGERCSCGTYAAGTFNRLFDMGYTKSRGLFAAQHGEVTIAGEVMLWGGIIPGSLGWRAQYAYPKTFLVPFSLWKQARPKELSEIYEVPFRLFNLERKH